MNDATMVSARGWWDLADRATFYPDDLPEDWQLSYFANCFHATLLPASFWRPSEASQFAQWRDEVPAGFRFVAEQPCARSTPAEPPLQAAILERWLAPKLAAWLEPVASAPRIPADAGEPAVEAWFRYLGPAPDAGSNAGEPNAVREHYAVQAPSALHQDLRGARHWLSALIEHQGQAPSLIILAQPSSNSLGAWQELLELLGLSQR
ncbi:DUF72 domain-containing protein [Halochromatium salexigens]|uniref:DUF72 domain-containing protein n=1 Tax=Halochromatium salexigens TaxID=49447 RepID=A0AAJ0XG20_HALSE|nr:DUF72 domain-containing protein [Halochromatium salexigens]MBK5931634.1 hypothetical protein [Halochromatium salexigens]